jgi:Helix-turn-helix domain
MRTVDWRTLWEDHGEPGELRRVLCALSNSMGGQGGQPPTNCSPSMARIARRAGMRRDSASRWIREAEREGWINVGRKTGLRNRYYATVPKDMAHLLPDEIKAQTKSKSRSPSKSASKPPRQKCHQCGSTNLRAKLYLGEDTGTLECQQCGTANDKEQS